MHLASQSHQGQSPATRRQITHTHMIYTIACRRHKVMVAVLFGWNKHRRSCCRQNHIAMGCSLNIDMSHMASLYCGENIVYIYIWSMQFCKWHCMSEEQNWKSHIVLCGRNRHRRSCCRQNHIAMRCSLNIDMSHMASLYCGENIVYMIHGVLLGRKWHCMSEEQNWKSHTVLCGRNRHRRSCCWQNHIAMGCSLNIDMSYIIVVKTLYMIHAVLLGRKWHCMSEEQNWKSHTVLCGRRCCLPTRCQSAMWHILNFQHQP